MAAIENAKQKFVVWFTSLSDSEQKLLKVASVIFIIYILYAMASSLSAGVTEAENKLAQQNKLNLWAEQQIAIIKNADPKNTSSNNSQGSMTQIINSTARTLNITIERLQPQKENLVKVGIDEIGFNTLLTWLSKLQTQHGISVKSIDFAKSDTIGLVKIRRLDLERA